MTTTRPDIDDVEAAAPTIDNASKTVPDAATRRRRRICLLLIATGVISAAGITSAVVFGMRAQYPELVVEEEANTTQVSLTSIYAGDDLARYAHEGEVHQASVLNNTQVTLAADGEDEYSILEESEKTDDFSSGDVTSSPTDFNTSVTDMDLAVLDVLRGEDGPSYTERVLHFDDEAKAILTQLREAAAEQGQGRLLMGADGIDSRRSVAENEVNRMPFAPVVRLRGTSWAGDTSGFCSGTLVDDDTVLTAAHCVYRHGKFQDFEIEVHPWKASSALGNLGTWGSGHKSCSWRPRISYPCGTRWCRRRWWGWYPCGVKTCTRYSSPLPDCTWRYQTKSIVVPEAWKKTYCQGHTSGGCPIKDFQHDIALVKLDKTQGKHAGQRADVATPVHTDTYSDQNFRITGYPGDRAPFLATATGPIKSRWTNVLSHDIDSNRGQSGSGLIGTTNNNKVYGVHVCGGPCARRIDAWWLRVMQSH